MLGWILESQVKIVNDHRDALKKSMEAGSITGLLVMLWAPIMCFPQWFGGLALGLLGSKPALAVFGARMAAMCIVRKLDEHIPYTRALGLCHLVTFSPVLLWLAYREPRATSSMDAYCEAFLSFQKLVISLCLFLDARDLLLHGLGHPFPCYIREAVQGGLIVIKDPRAQRPVTLPARLIGP